MAKKKRSRSAIGRRNRQKGKEYQKHIAEVLGDALGLPEDEVFSALSGTTGADVRGSREFKRLFPFASETKDCKQISMPAWIAEARANAEEEELPFALIFKTYRRKGDFVVLDLKEFLKWVI